LVLVLQRRQRVRVHLVLQRLQRPVRLVRLVAL
jgi:hypothetical protein